MRAGGQGATLRRMSDSEPRIVTVWAPKGGTGKTTIAYELAYMLDAPLVNLEWDSGGASAQWGLKEPEPYERARLLQGLRTGKAPRPMRAEHRPDLVPGHPDLEDALPAAEDLADLLTKWAAEWGRPYVVIDTHPGSGRAGRGAVAPGQPGRRAHRAAHQGTQRAGDGAPRVRRISAADRAEHDPARAAGAGARPVPAHGPGGRSAGRAADQSSPVVGQAPHPLGADLAPGAVRPGEALRRMERTAASGGGGAETCRLNRTSHPEATAPTRSSSAAASSPSVVSVANRCRRGIPGRNSRPPSSPGQRLSRAPAGQRPARTPARKRTARREAESIPLRLGQFYVTASQDEALRRIRAEGLISNMDVSGSAVVRYALDQLLASKTPAELAHLLGTPKGQKQDRRGRPRR